MGQTLTDQEVEILKSRLQIGEAGGHRQLVHIAIPTNESGVEEDIEDVSDRVISIGRDSSLELDADALTILLDNADGAFNFDDATADLYLFSRPGLRAIVWQWYGDVANQVVTFTGRVTAIDIDEAAAQVTLHVYDAFYPLLQTEIIPEAPQDPTVVGAEMEMPNYVYVNKTAKEVLMDLITVKGSIPEALVALADPPFAFSLITFQSGSVGDAVLRVAELSGQRVWADAYGIIRSAEITTVPDTYWTFEADTDVTTLVNSMDDADSKTLVRVVGSADVTDPTNVLPIIGSVRDDAFAAEWGEDRALVVRADNARTVEECEYTALRKLAEVARFRHRRVIGIVGHPGLEKGDNVTLRYWRRRSLPPAPSRRFYLRDLASDVATRKLASTVGGSGLASYVGDTTDGSETMYAPFNYWLTEPFAEGFTLAGPITFNLWGLESDAAANAGIGIFLSRHAEDGTLLNAIDMGGPDGMSAPGSEWGIGVAAATWTGTPLYPDDAPFQPGDRLGIWPAFVDAGGAMVGGYTTTLDYDGPPDADGDSWIELTERIALRPSGSALEISNLQVISIRTEQDARAGTYLGIAVVEPFQILPETIS